MTYSWVAPNETSPSIAKLPAADWDAACEKARELAFR